MAAVEDDVDDRFSDIDIESLLSRVQRRPLTFIRKSIYLAPDFVERLKGEQNVEEGNDLTLSFRVTGVPRPTLRWFKDDEEVKDHPRLTVEEGEDGGYRLTLHQINKGDEAAYRCRAENSEGASSCCFFLTVKGKPRSPRREGKGMHKRTVSFPTMFSTIVEKVEEEDKAWHETSRATPSPLTQLYGSLTLKGRTSWPAFLGDWAFVNGSHKARGGSVPPEDRLGATSAREARASSEPRTTSTTKTPASSPASTSTRSQLPSRDSLRPVRALALPHLKAVQQLAPPPIENLRRLREGSPMTFSLTQQKQQGKTVLTSLRPRTLCFFSRAGSSSSLSEPSESELYRKMLIAHRRGLRRVDKPMNF